MYLKDDYHGRILKKIDDLASRIHLLKVRIAKQEVTVRLRHYEDLANICCRFAELKWRLGQLELEDDIESKEDLKAIETCWSGLMNAVDALLVALP